MTVGSVDMSRERASSNPRSPLPPTSPLLQAAEKEGEGSGKPAGRSRGGGGEGEEKDEGKREGKGKVEETESQEPEHRSVGWKRKQWQGEKVDKPQSPVGSMSRKMRKEGTSVAQSGSSARAPSISIEPNTSLELTEEMMLGESEVVTTDTLLAKASGSDKHEMGVSVVFTCISSVGVYK